MIKVRLKTSKLDLLTQEAGVFPLKTKSDCDVSVFLIPYLLILTQSPCRWECRAAHSMTINYSCGFNANIFTRFMSFQIAVQDVEVPM